MNTPAERLDQAIRDAAAAVDWRDGEPPVIVGCYCDNLDEGNDEDSLPERLTEEANTQRQEFQQ